MKIPRVRLTIRRLMVAVAIVGCLIAAFEAGRRWERNHAPAPRPFLYYNTLSKYYSSLRPNGAPAKKVAGRGVPANPAPPSPPPPE